MNRESMKAFNSTLNNKQQWKSSPIGEFFIFVTNNDGGQLTNKSGGNK